MEPFHVISSSNCLSPVHHKCHKLDTINKSEKNTNSNYFGWGRTQNVSTGMHRGGRRCGRGQCGATGPSTVPAVQVERGVSVRHERRFGRVAAAPLPAPRH